MLPLLLIAAILLLAGVWLIGRAQSQRQATGLPAGEIVYVDTGKWQRNQRSLFSRRYQLTGKPDYLIETGGELIPVEVKSTRIGSAEPYDSHKLQVAAYCLLVEDTSGRRPSYGIIQYADSTIRLPFSDDLRSELLNTLDAMRQSFSAAGVDRSHDDAIRCRNCGFSHACEQQLAGSS
ncbi:MAG: Dna2/Cas4 domain-containing protein [Caldilineales bacterium]|nr:Dna2/Cas4 domain-containing protein [Caldilineales bacterium]